MDCASYHCSRETRNYIANQGLKVVLGGVYGYKLAPIEMLFGSLKEVDLNPMQRKTGKR